MANGGPAPGGTVLLVANYEPDVGLAWRLMERFWVLAAERAATHGLAACLAYPVEGPIPETITAAPLETVIHPVAPGCRRGWIRRTLRLVRSRRVRLVYFTDRPMTHPVYPLLRLAGVRRILVHDHTPGDRPPVPGLRGWLKHVWRRVPWLSADRVIAVSPFVRERAIRNARYPASRIAVVQNGVPPAVISPDRTYAHRVLGLPRDAMLCVTVGRAHPYKRIDTMVRVAARCRACCPDVPIVFVHCGDGPDLTRLQAMAADAGVGDQVRFAGRRDDVPQILGSADLALHPSRGEAFSLAVVEYMQAGLPVVVPDLRSVCQAVRHEVSGLVYPDGDVDAAAKQVCRLAADAALRSRLGSAAAETVRRDYAWEVMEAQFQQVIDHELRQLR
jgi:glycosyltransferase involved in cell wall biosynthesis